MKRSPTTLKKREKKQNENENKNHYQSIRDKKSICDQII